MTSPFHSIRWRIQAWHGLVLLIMVAAFCLTAWRLAWNTAQRRIDNDLRATEHRLFRALMHSVFEQEEWSSTNSTKPAPTPADLMKRLRDREHPLRLSAEIEESLKSTAPGYTYFIIRDSDGTILFETGNVPANLTFPPPPQAPANENENAPEPIRTNGTHRESFRGSPEGIVSLVGRDISPELAEMRRLAWSLAAAGATVWLIGLAGGWWIAGRAIRPIRAISHTATQIAGGDLAERIDTRDAESELGQLARVLNDTFERLHASIEQQKRFTADASHELRTPISILIAETQRILKRDRTASEYRESLQICADTAARMRHLVEALLLLARQETGRPAEHAPIDLADIVRETSRQLASLAATRNLSIDTAGLQSAPCKADPMALQIVTTNLVTNAIQHHHSVPGTIKLKTSVTPTHVRLVVEDDGPGIPSADLPHIFDRFYRADKARTHADTPHSGLGLAIARQIVENHHGTIEARNNPWKGASFEVHLPFA